MDCSPPGPSFHGIFQARILDCVVISFSRGSSWPWDWMHLFCLLHWQLDSLALCHLGSPLFCFFIVVQLLSCVHFSMTPWTAAHQATLSFTISWSLLKLMSIESVMTLNHLILCRPLLLLPSVFPSIRVFSNELAFFVRWTKYWRFNFSISPSNEYSGLIFFRIDWFDLLAVQGTPKSFPQHYSSKASVLRHLAFFMAQLSHLYMTTGKNITLTRWIFVGKVLLLL